MVQNLGKGIDEDGEVTEMVQSLEEPVKPIIDEAKPKPKSLSDCGMLRSVPGPENTNQDGMIKEFGRLVVDEGRSRYVSNKFWNSLSEEVSNMFHSYNCMIAHHQEYTLPETWA